MKRIFTKVLFLIIGAVSLAAAPEICHSSWGGCHITGVYFDQLDYTEFTISCTDGFYLKQRIGGDEVPAVCF